MFRFAASCMPVNLRRIGLVALACSSALVLNACGGGDRAAAYNPTRMVSFGDENSLVDSYTSSAILKGADGLGGGVLKGLVYTVNTVGVATSLVCANDTATPYAGCSTTSGTFSADTDSTIEYFVFDPANANFLSAVERDTANATQRVTDTVYSCVGSTIWTQVIAHNFRLGYQSYQGSAGQCPSDSYGGAVTYATNQAKVADVVAQIAAHRGDLTKGVLVTLMAGQHDILELYALVKAGSMTEASAQAELRNRAATLANAVRDVISTGAKVVLALTPDLGESPKAFESGENQALLSSLTKVFNDRLYITELGSTSGRDLAGVNPEPYTNPSTRTSSYVYRAPLCDLTATRLPGQPSVAAADVKYCTLATLVSGGSTSTYIWADSTHYAPLGHSIIGSAGYSRASNQF